MQRGEKGELFIETQCIFMGTGQHNETPQARNLEFIQVLVTCDSNLLGRLAD